MRQHGLHGISRGRKKPIVHHREALYCASDLVKCHVKASEANQLWVADFTYIYTQSGWVYTAFIIDVYSRAIVGWKVSRQMNTDMVVDALDQAWVSRAMPKNVVHHSDRGSQYLSIRYSERLKEAGIKASVGRTGDAYDNALAESVNGLYKAEVIDYDKR